jgi:surface protein
MKKKTLLLRFAVLVTAMTCALGANADPYVNYTPSNTTLTFYLDDLRNTRPGTTYDLNTGNNTPGWKNDGTFANVTKVVFDPMFAYARPETTYAWFHGMQNLQSITGIRYLNTSQTTSMRFMFYGCSGLTSVDLSRFNTTNVTSMLSMFYGCSGLTSLNVSNFNTSNVTDTRSMFRNCTGLTSLDLGNFNTANVTSMGNMFNGCTNLTTIYAGSGWTTDAVSQSTDMFSGCTSLVGGQGTTWNASNPTDKTYAHIDGGTSNPGYFTRGTEAYACYTSSNTTLTFYYDNQRASRTGTIYDLNPASTNPGWKTDGTNADVTKVVFDPSFAGARPVTTCNWFYGMGNLESITGMSYLNTSEVTNMAWMFTNCTKLTSLDVSHFNTSKVTDMSGSFEYCSALTRLDLSSFNTSKVNYMNWMFNGCSNLRTIYVGNGWSTATVTQSVEMFKNCTSLVGGQGTTYSSSNPKDKTYAHIDGGPSNPGYFTAKTEAYACYTSSNTTLTFYYDNQRSSRTGTTYDLNTGSKDPGWETDGTNINVTKVVFDPSFADARPTTTYNWFYYMLNLQSITGMSCLNTSEVTNMGAMFAGCNQLMSIDVSHFNTSKVTSMSGMFNACGVTSLDLSSFNTDNVTTMGGMFSYSEGLTSVDLSSFTTTRVTRTANMFEGCSALTTIYASSSWSLPANNYSWAMFLDCTSLVGGQGTTYDADHVDAEYAHIDGGPGNPGYFTAKFAGMRGDVNGDGGVDITAATMLINYLLSGNANGLNMDNANCDQNGGVDISDATTLINFLLNGLWP